MSYNILLTETFMKCIKILKKKYRRIKDDILIIIKVLEENPGIGVPIPGWQKEIWKIRVASSDIKKGKRSGFRLVYFWKEQERNVYLMAVYFKGTKEDISVKEIRKMLDSIKE